MEALLVQVHELLAQAGDSLEQQGIPPIALAGSAVLVSMYFAFFNNKRCTGKAITVSLTDMERLDVFESSESAPSPDSNDPPQAIKVASRPGKIQCYDPSTARFLGEVEDMSAERVLEVVALARAAQPTWAKTSFAQRKEVLMTLLRYTMDHSDEIARVTVKDSGKTKLGSYLGEIIPTCEKINWIINYGEDVLKPEKRGGQSLFTLHKSARVEYHPLGVLGVIAPWNYPCHNFMNHIISGLFAGDAVVVKVSEFTSWSSAYMLRIVRTALEAHGHNPDLVQVVTGTAAAGQALVAGAVDKIIFTGSAPIGKLIMKGAAPSLTPVVLELGGKDPFIVCASASVDHVLPLAMRGVFQNSGQNCAGVERIFVHENLHDEFVDKFVAQVKNLKQGRPLEAPAGEGVDLGAMTTVMQLELVDSLVKDAVADGAKLVIGGKINAALAPGLFYEPTVLTGVTPGMRITKAEVFGPVCVVMKWKTHEELLAVANDCDYALGSSVFTTDAKEAKYLLNALDAGMTNVNDFGINYLVQSLPFGGVKHSGFGHFGGPEGLRACCNLRSITDDALPKFLRPAVPKPLQYPTTAKSPDFAAGLMRLSYGPTPVDRIKGIVGLIKGSM